MRIAAVAAALLFVLAGCTGAASGENSTAFPGRDAAHDAAAELGADPELMAIFAAEWTNTSFGSEFTQESQQMAAIDQGVDSELGDGWANAWAYLYRSGEDSIMVIVAGGGRVLSTEIVEPEEDAEDFWADVPLGEVSIDSDVAATALRDGSEQFSNLIDRDDAVVVMALARDEDTDTPYWLFTAFVDRENGDEDDFYFGLVNAQTGEVQEIPFF